MAGERLIRSARSAPRPHKSSGLAAQLTPIPCPCCSTPMRVPTFEVVVFHYKLSPFQARILDAVWRGRGLPVQAERIFDAMYLDDPDGGPTPPKMYAAFKEALHRMREKLAGSGIGIESAGYRAGYRLVMGVARGE
jgi:hypothetical protein